MKYYTETQPVFAIEEWTPYYDMEHVSVSLPDFDNGSPVEGDMIVADRDSPTDKWLISAKFFKNNYVEVTPNG